MNTNILDSIKYIVDNSVFYKSKYSDFIKNKKDFAADFNLLPYTTKREILEDQALNPPYGSNLCVKPNSIQRVHKTSGTTNKPLIVVLTENDIKKTVEVGMKCFISSGLTKDDTVIHCLSYNMWMGGYTDHQSLEATGAAVIPFGVGHSNNLIETILTLKPTAIHCTPSYLATLELILKQDYQLSPLDLGLKLGLFGAESGLQNPLFRKSIETKWGLKAMNANYGMADVLSMFGAECKYQNGLHFMGDGILYPELLDPKTLKLVSIEKGSIGELVLTNLCREAQPVIRYRTNDIIKILETEQCKCGHTGFRFEIIGRSDDMIVVKGVNVFVNAVEKLIFEHHDVFTGVYNIHINKTEPIDRVVIVIEKNNSISNEDYVKSELMKKIKTRLNFTPEINLVHEGELPRTEGKSKKIYKTL